MFSPLQPIYPTAGIRALESLAGAGAEPTLMERAGRAAAEEAVRLTADRAGPALIVCGPGNNGGDGFVMARRLIQAKRQAVVVYADDPAKLPADARIAYDAWLEAGGTLTDTLPEPPPEGWSLIVDALFGIGLQRPVSGRYAEWIDTLNALPYPRMAIDLPSGLNADTGAVMGTAFKAAHTLTFIALKPGLLTLDGMDHAGAIIVRRIDIEPENLLEPEGYLVSPALFRAHLKTRPFNSHKGCFGDVGIIGGDAGMAGAALLAARAALKLGAGRVFVGCLDNNLPPVDFQQPELMLRRPGDLFQYCSAIAIGPGLGTSASAIELIHKAVKTETPLVLDADALNIIAHDPDLQAQIGARKHPTLMTPHPAEAARLLGCSVADVQSDRILAALTLAQRHQAHVVLKGSGSLIATPAGRWYINCSGHPGMASAGMGDVLTGLVTSLLAQHWPVPEALIAAAHLHGAAADRLSREGVGPIGLSASEVVEASRGVFNGWIVQAQQNPRSHEQF